MLCLGTGSAVDIVTCYEDGAPVMGISLLSVQDIFWRLLSADERRVEMLSLDALCLGMEVTVWAVRLLAAVRNCTPVFSMIMYRAPPPPPRPHPRMTDKHRLNAPPHALQVLRPTLRFGGV